MSVYGIDIRNRNDQFLVNSNFSSLHYVGKASVESNTPIATVLDGSVETTYTRSVPGGVQPYPFITCPRNDRTYGVIGIENYSGNNWRIRVLRSGAAAEPAPEMYIFSDVTGATLDNSYGLRVWNSSTGLPSFDSSRNPISIKHTKSLLSATDPTEGRDPAIAPRDGSGIYTAPWTNCFTPTSKRAYSYSTSGISKPIFFYPSTAFHVQRRLKTDYEEDKPNSIWGTVSGKTTFKYWVSDYWVFYRAGIRNVRNGLMETRWVPISWGAPHTYKQQTGYNLFSLNLIAWTSSGLTWSGGRGPYAEGTINDDDNVTLILNGASYD